jgi:hypothetical protein
MLYLLYTGYEIYWLTILVKEKEIAMFKFVLYL